MPADTGQATQPVVAQAAGNTFGDFGRASHLADPGFTFCWKSLPERAVADDEKKGETKDALQ
ncbi:MAG: hypothetical protein KUL75_00945 [Sterolibacterium sp.]|nr:hypothetical protein [Sterolibacterium sp.]